jgi:hypothetical protein
MTDYPNVDRYLLDFHSLFGHLQVVHQTTDRRIVDTD